MQLWVIRHAETKGNTAGILRGAASAQDEITETGHAQARALAEHLSRGEPRPLAVYASRYRRAQQTAEPLAQRLGCAVQILDGLHELDCGAWAGQPYSALREHPEQLTLANGDLGFRGGETFEGIAHRFLRDLNALPVQNSAVVSHGGIIRIGLTALLALDQRKAWRQGLFLLGNTGFVRLEKQENQWTLAETQPLPDWSK
ncbi:histidine phosphatase family protein [Deinococcus taeanensis]|uniref:histidine phosphatase family protein n=1 Tax=Deinococcus taeanensis TaxID=2737050 RepID=UPI001CDBD196|nr:histidine phosphatase family protein [Deinococcus taeanensis]UBV43802.1 histidine phosphatase family protein [Deinococcus taeanensis]